MKYRNTKTGMVIDVESVIQGGDWELVKAPKPAKKAVKKDDTIRNDR